MSANGTETGVRSAAVGSFVRWLKETEGGEKLRALYRKAEWEPVYGRPAEAQARWEIAHGRPLPDPIRSPG